MWGPFGLLVAALLFPTASADASLVNDAFPGQVPALPTDVADDVVATLDGVIGDAAPALPALPIDDSCRDALGIHVAGYRAKVTDERENSTTLNGAPQVEQILEDARHNLPSATHEALSLAQGGAGFVLEALESAHDEARAALPVGGESNVSIGVRWTEYYVEWVPEERRLQTRIGGLGDILGGQALETCPVTDLAATPGSAAPTFENVWLPITGAADGWYPDPASIQVAVRLQVNADSEPRTIEAPALGGLIDAEDPISPAQGLVDQAAQVIGGLGAIGEVMRAIW